MTYARRFWERPVVILQQTQVSARTGRKHPGAETISENDKDSAEREQGAKFMPRFDKSGLIAAVVTDADDGTVLMVAFMDLEALDKTRTTGLAHFHSRSRGKLWLKGESSGNMLEVREILVDCDQDALVIKAKPRGPTCHTLARSCFYRRLERDCLERIDD